MARQQVERLFVECLPERTHHYDWTHGKCDIITTGRLELPLLDSLLPLDVLLPLDALDALLTLDPLEALLSLELLLPLDALLALDPLLSLDARLSLDALLPELAELELLELPLELLLELPLLELLPLELPELLELLGLGLPLALEGLLVALEGLAALLRLECGIACGTTFSGCTSTPISSHRSETSGADGW